MAEQVTLNSGEQICKVCGLPKAFTEFFKVKKSYSARCKTCSIDMALEPIFHTKAKEKAAEKEKLNQAKRKAAAARHKVYIREYKRKMRGYYNRHPEELPV